MATSNPWDDDQNQQQDQWGRSPGDPDYGKAPDYGTGDAGQAAQGGAQAPPYPSGNTWQPGAIPGGSGVWYYPTGTGAGGAGGTSQPVAPSSGNAPNGSAYTTDAGGFMRDSAGNIIGYKGGFYPQASYGATTNGATANTPTQGAAQTTQSAYTGNPLDLIKQYQQQHPNAAPGSSRLSDLLNYMQSQGLQGWSLATHAGGSAASDDKIVSPTGEYYDIANDQGWMAPGSPLHWDPSVNIVNPSGGFQSMADYLQGLGMDVPSFTPMPGDGLPEYSAGNPFSALYSPEQYGGAGAETPFADGGGGAGGGAAPMAAPDAGGNSAPTGTPSVAAQAAQQLAASPNMSASMKQTFENLLMQNATQSKEVNQNDPIIRNQVEAFSGQQQQSLRNYLSALAEHAGPMANISAETRAGNEQVGQNTSSFQASLMAQELSARRQEIAQALSQMGAYITDEEKMSLQAQLAQLDNALQYARLAQDESQFGRSLSERSSEFGRSLAEQGYEFGANLNQRDKFNSMANALAYANLGQHAYEFDTTRNDNLFG